MFLELNITNEEKLLLSSNAFITSINVCNTGGTDVVLGLYKQKEGDATKFHFLKDVTLKKKYTFLGEAIEITEGDTFYVSVASGSCSVIVDYK